MAPIPTRLVTVALATTAAINVVTGVAALLGPSWNASLFLGPDVVMEGSLLRHHLLLWSFVVAMGVGYGVAARDPSRNPALLLAGGLGKLFAAGIWIEMVISGHGTPLLLGGVVFDGSLGVLFLAFLATERADGPASS